MPRISRLELQNSLSLWRELGVDLDQHAAVVAQRHQRIVAWAGQPEIQLEPARGVSRRSRDQAEKTGKEKREKTAHDGLPRNGAAHPLKGQEAARRTSASVA